MPICWIVGKAREFQKNIYAKAFDCVDYNKLWNILKEMGIPDHLTCILRNLYAGQETTVRTRHVLTRTVDCSKVGKEYVKAVYCHPAYVTFLQSTSKYNYRKLTKLITWITALSNSMKL